MVHIRGFVWFTLICSAFALAGSVGPVEVIRAATEQVVHVLNTVPGIGTGSSRLNALIEQTVMPHVDFAVLPRLTLGKHWRQATPQQRARFEKELHNLLLRTYAASVTRYRNQRIEYGSTDQNPEKRTASVHTRILEDGNPPIAVDYSLRQVKSEWKIYDVRIEGISLVVNFRHSFATTIQSNGLDGLIDQLAERNVTAREDDPFVKETLRNL